VVVVVAVVEEVVHELHDTAHTLVYALLSGLSPKQRSESLEQNVGSCIPLQVGLVDVTVVLVVCVVCAVIVVLVFEREVTVEVTVVAVCIIVTEVVSVSVEVDVAVAVVKVAVTRIQESQCMGHRTFVASPTDPGKSHNDLAIAHSGGSRFPLQVAAVTVYVVEVVVA
jgi:hypothetical protein